MYHQSPQPAARPRADSQADDHRRPAGPEVRPRLLHLRGARLGRGRRRRRYAVPPVAPTEGAREVRTVGVVGTGTMATGIIEVFAKAGNDVVFVPEARTRPRPRAKTSASPSTRPVQRGKLAEDDRAPRRSAASPGRRARRPRRLRPGHRGRRRGARPSSRRFSPPSTRCASPAPCSPPPLRRLPVIECAAATSRPGDVVGMHFFNPAPVMKLVEIVPTIATAPDVVATAHAVCATLGKQPVPAATGPASSSTRCCSPTSTTR